MIPTIHDERLNSVWLHVCLYFRKKYQLLCIISCVNRGAKAPMGAHIPRRSQGSRGDLTLGDIIHDKHTFTVRSHPRTGVASGT